MNKILIGFSVASLMALPALAIGPDSGLAVGERVSAYHPTHVSGPHKGTDTCPT